MNDSRDRIINIMLSDELDREREASKRARAGWDKALAGWKDTVRAFGWALFAAGVLGLALTIDIAFRGWP